MQSFDDSTRAILVAVGQDFSVEVAGNPTSGYLWEARIEERYLELMGQEVQPGSMAAGAGGHEHFCFHALATGETEILLEYRRPWETEPRDARRFRVEIT